MSDWDEIQVIKQLIEGLTPENALDRLSAIVERLSYEDWHVRTRVLQSNPLSEGSMSSGGSIADALVEACAANLAFAARNGAEPQEVQGILSPLEEPTRQRFWMVFVLEQHDQDLLVRAVEDVFGSKMPASEDVQALERLDSGAIESMIAALPQPPSVSAVQNSILENTIAEELVRQWVWLELVEPKRADWAEVSVAMEERFGPVSRDTFLDPGPRMESYNVGSPIESSELLGVRPLEVSRIVSSWRRSPQDHTVDTRELARTLQSVVKADAPAWTVDPVVIAETLREPIYIAHFLRGLAEAVPTLATVDAASLVDVVRLADSEPWEPVALGSADWDYDPDWTSCRDASIDLIEALAKADVSLGHCYDYAWRFLEGLARDTTRDSGILSESDPMTLAINRSCTRAMRALFNVAASRFRTLDLPEPRLDTILTWVLTLRGPTGLQFRAVLVPWIPYLEQLLPEWVAIHGQRIYDENEPLGLETLALALQWSRPDRRLLESHRDAVFTLVGTDAENALSHALIAMLREMVGYPPRAVAQELARLGPGFVSQGGESIARLLREPDLPEGMIGIGVDFWQEVLEAGGSGERLTGFGWWADVSTLDEQVWRSLMLETVRKARGNIAWSERVASRLLEQTDEATIEALDWLISGVSEPWERGIIAQLTSDHAASLQELPHSDRILRLNRTLITFGFPALSTTHRDS